ncbi:hypothetical protein RND81_14G197700 [Saponaria officinalis]|uniref:Retrovirus-related Pol polyprotein from transposon TNT 1-94-like beta-barrel domain-containing protein n=1 Tax=Saponaria officinalis TaxID=3572 RepID=A0AAW1GSB4_SAPOF
MGLNDTYDNLRSNILSMEPLPSINKAYSIVQQIESQKHISNILNSTQNTSAFLASGADFDSSAQAFSVRRFTGKRSWKKEFKKQKLDDRWCEHCNRRGHTRETCFKLHPDLRVKYQARFPTANNAIVQSNTECVSDGMSQKNELKVEPALVNALYKEMVKMFQSQGSGVADTPFSAVNFVGKILVTNATSSVIDECRVSWIMNSGATDHMSSQKHLFRGLKSLPTPVTICLPDGTTKTVVECGNVMLNSEVTLYDVLLVPDFKHNLISVSKLLLHNGLLIEFDATKCVLQAPLSKRAVAFGV